MENKEISRTSKQYEEKISHCSTKIIDDLIKIQKIIDLNELDTKNELTKKLNEVVYNNIADHFKSQDIRKKLEQLSARK